MTITANDNTNFAAIADFAKWAFTTRRVNQEDVCEIVSVSKDAKAGDLILCEIVQVGQHKKI